jgi:hypothetical protein
MLHSGARGSSQPVAASREQHLSDVLHRHHDDVPDLRSRNDFGNKPCKWLGDHQRGRAGIPQLVLHLASGVDRVHGYSDEARACDRSQGHWIQKLIRQQQGRPIA